MARTIKSARRQRRSATRYSLHRTVPNVAFERRAWSNGVKVVAGVDESGRGAWAGPLVAAAVILPRAGSQRGVLTRTLRRCVLEINDSKRLTVEKRVAILDVAHQLEVHISVAVVEVTELDILGLGEANRQALYRAVQALDVRVDHVLVDGFPIPDLSCSQEAIVRGDQLSTSIALASIAAKVHRDRIMIDLDGHVPDYGFASHKGYGTRAHEKALAHHGVSEYHRTSFAPVAKLIKDG